jgi:hypothetical protein
VKDLSLGEKNGKKYGKKFAIAVMDAVKISNRHREPPRIKKL